MHSRDELNAAEAIHAYRATLKATLDKLVERGEPILPSEAELLQKLADARLGPAEGLLRADLNRRLSGRLRLLVRARIGQLRHHDPRPLAVPMSYMRAVAPTSAPAIAVVTPSFQQGRYLDRTLYSVIAQDYPALEYVVQDGGSTDESVDILHRFSHAVTSWASERDSGQADAINRGFRQTRAEIMAWLNSDDLLLPGTLAFVARYFDAHPDVDVLYGNRLMIDENDGHIGSWILPAHDDTALTLADYVPQETLFWRRRIWDAAGAGVDPTFRFALDWDLLLRFRGAGAKIVHVPRFLGAFRVHDEQKTVAEEARGAVECDVIRQRLHGRPLPLEEVLQRLRPYLIRHLVAYARFRARSLVPSREVVVRTIPTEPSLRRPIPEAQPEPRAGDAAVLPLPPHDRSAAASAASD